MDFSFDDVRAFIIRHYQYFVVGILFVILVIVLAIYAKGAGEDAGGKSSVSSDSAVSGNSAEGDTQVEVPDVPLELDAYPAVNDLMSRYFTAMADGDTATLLSICSELDEMEQIRIEKKAEYIESCSDFKCYTKPGPVDNSYIAFTYYKFKFKNIDTPAPCLTTLYIKTDDSGELYVYDGELTDEESQYIRAVAAQDDVVDLLNKVDSEYNEAIDSDATLKNFSEALSAALDRDVSQELSDRQSAAAEATPSENSAESSGSNKATVKDTVNVRKTASTEGDRLGKLMKGDSVTVVEMLDNGWCKIDYQGEDAYVKAEFLSIEGVESTQPGGEDEADDGIIGKVTVKEGKTNINIRKSMSADSESLGTANGGDSFDLQMDLDTGWCKIKYNDQDAYVKTELVDVKKD